MANLYEFPNNPALTAIEQPMLRSHPYALERAKGFGWLGWRSDERNLILCVSRRAYSKVVDGVPVYKPFEEVHPPEWFAERQALIGPDLWILMLNSLTGPYSNRGPAQDPNIGSGVPPLPVPYPPAGTFRRARRANKTWDANPVGQYEWEP